MIGSLGIVQVIAGTAILATSPAEMTSYGSDVYITPTDGKGVGGALLMINGSIMTSIGVKLMISGKDSKKRKGGRGGSKSKRRIRKR